MTAMRLLVVLCTAALTLAAPAAAASPVRATMVTTSSTPLVDTPWRYTITVKDQGGKPLAAKVRLQILLGTLVVGCWKGSAMMPCSGASAGTWISFKGKRTGHDHVARAVRRDQVDLPGDRRRGRARAQAPRAGDRSASLATSRPSTR